MSLFDADLQGGRKWCRVGDGYEVTKKPRGLALSSLREIPFASMEAIPQGGGYQPEFTLKAPSDIVSGTYFELGDILVAKITPCFENGKQALIKELAAPFGYATTEVIPVHPRSPAHDPRVLFFYLLHPDVRHYLTERMEGATGRQRVPESVLLDLPIPGLGPDEQTAIADSLELIQRASIAEARSEAAARAFKRATMQLVFTCGLRRDEPTAPECDLMPEGWTAEPLGAHHSVVSGGTPSRGNPLYWEGGTIPWVKTTEVNYCVIRETGEYITQAGLDGSAAKLLPAGTLLLAMYGQGVTRGKVAILGIEAACNQACAAIRATDAAVNPGYLYHFLSCKYNEIRGLAHGGQQQNLNLDIVRNFLITFPKNLGEQREIVTILDAIDEKVELHRRKREVLQELFQALLHKLMTGEVGVGDLVLAASTSAAEEMAA